MANRNVGRLENGGESAELMAQSGAYLPSQDEVSRSLNVASQKKLWRFSIRDFIL